MAEDLIPHSEVREGATLVRNTITPETVENNHTSAPNANANFVTPVTNGTTEIEAKTKNKIISITTDKETIIPSEIITYTVKLDEKNTDTLEADLKKVKFCFWLQDKNKKTVPLEIALGKAAVTEKKGRGAIRILKKGSVSATDYTTDFLVPKGNENLTANITKSAYYYSLISVDKDKKEVTLQVKFSKWLDTYKVRTEAYFSGGKIKGDGGNTTASRTVKATPEILDAYWLNAAGRKITYTGYKQEAYLYLKTLGLQGKTLETQVFDADIHLNPALYSQENTTDDKIDWKNNKIKIEGKEVIKQFKVGNLKRYANAHADEGLDDPSVVGLYNYDYKKINDLELYIHIANSDALKIENVKPKYGKLRLTSDEKINDAFFAKIETEKVQADAPEIKTKKGTKLPPKAKVPYYEKIDHGVIGQKIQLVAQCTNLEGKEVVFKIYEKEKVLVEKDKELPVFQKGKKVTEIKATVTDGFAVAGIELKYSKEQKDNKDWLKKLKNGFYDTTGKTSNLFIEVETPAETILSSKSFLRQNPFKFISNNWHDPVDDPQICIWNSSGIEKPQSNTFGTGRGRLHTGLDIFSIEKTNAYACLDGTVYERKWHSGYGWTITIKIDNPNELANRRREYTHAYNTDKDSGAKFKEDKNPIYLFYAHLHDIFVKKGQKIKAGKKIGLTGISGVKGGTYDPHLHFNIFSTVYAVGKEYKDYLADPALYVYWKTEKQLTNNEKQIQKTRKDKGKNSSKTFFKPKLSI